MRYRITPIILILLFIILSYAAPSPAGDYIIGEGDRLQISVWGVDRLNFDVKVRPDGMITVPGLGDVPASGFRPEDLKKSLAERLKDLVKNPIVTVTVSDITNTKVFIFGNGTKPGIYDINRKTTLLQILCTLNDIKNADLKNAYLLRNKEKIKQGFHTLFINGDISEDIQIEPNDALFIPAHSDRSIYVMGGINSPKAIEFRDGISFMEAILEAGSFSKFANRTDIKIIRKDAGKEATISVNAEKIVNDGDLQQNIKLRPGDFVIITESIF